MDFVNGFNRNQLIMMDFEANVAPDSWARVVDWFVNALPLKNLGFKDVLNTEGRPPYRSADMLKLFMYGYKKKLRSSYQLEEACKVNIEVIWLPPIRSGFDLGGFTSCSVLKDLWITKRGSIALIKKKVLT